VTFPAYGGTDVTVRSAGSDIDSFVRALPADLRQALRVSLSVADLPAATELLTDAMLQSVDTDERAALSGTGDLAVDSNEQALGVTRQEMRMRALSLLGVPNEPDRGAA
jgi:hypothetical protein